MGDLLNSPWVQGGALGAFFILTVVVVRELFEMVKASRNEITAIAKDSYITNQKLSAAVERMVDEIRADRERSIVQQQDDIRARDKAGHERSEILREVKATRG